jgi:hypothetical protein
MAKQTPLAFFSYSREDSEFALRLAKDLRTAGATVWLDQLDINPGQRWDRAVEEALASCPRMLVILSPSSVASTNVMDEVSFALEEKKLVIPVLARDCNIPFRLRRLQYIDCRADYAGGLKELVKTLEVGEQAEVTGSGNQEAAAASAHQGKPDKSGREHEHRRPEAARTEPEPSRKKYWIAGGGAGAVMLGLGLWYGGASQAPGTGTPPSVENRAPAPVRRNVGGEDAASTSTANVPPSGSYAQAPSPGAKPGEEWFVILHSYARSQRPAAEKQLMDLQETFRNRGLELNPRLIESDSYPNLTPGLWVIALGPEGRSKANEARRDVLAVVPGAYVKSGR